MSPGGTENENIIIMKLAREERNGIREKRTGGK